MINKKLHIPIEPIQGGGITHWSYIDIEYEEDKVGKILEDYQAIRDALKPRAGLESKEWNAVLDRYLHGDEKMEADKHAAMSERQQKLINEIKKSNNRNK